MIRNIFSVLALVVAMSTLTIAQQQTDRLFEREWKQIDSLMDKGLPQSAAKIARAVLNTAREKEDSSNAIKAELFLMDVTDAIQENEAISNIRRIDSIITQSTGAEKALWQSINATRYWQYYQRNRWTILGRTPVIGTPPADIATWDAASFIDRASELYQASIIDREMLQTIPVEHYTPLLIAGENTRHLRPTLYDFLAFRAIDFFQNDEKDVIRPANQFQIDGTLWFAPAERLAKVKVNPLNPESLHFRALHTYQQLLSFHLSDEKPDALIDADLKRLAFVHQYSVHPQKDSLYVQALQSLEQRYPNEPAGAQVTYQKLDFLYENRSGSTDTLHLPALKRQLDELIARFPSTEGALNAAQLRYTVTSQSVSLQSEAVVLPGENSKVLISYRNLNQVFLRIYQLPVHRDGRRQQLSDEEQAALLESKPLRAWSSALPGADDLNEHRTELKIDLLSPGSYLLVASAKREFVTDENALHAVPFQVSNVSAIIQRTTQGNWLVALHRKSGMPLRGAEVIFWENDWNSSTRAYEYTRLGQSRTDEDGKARITAPGTRNNRINRITLISHGDTLQTDGYFYDRDPDKVEEKTRKQTFIFTDRGIYRPGQTIYFKGILVEHDIQQKNNTVLANAKREVTLYDANNQKVSTLQLTTNEYGSFAGKFTAPESGLTGQMRIADANGTVYFSVEEYKRPKFQVIFYTVKAAVALNETVVITGQAQAFAGNDIGSATVTYRVVRRAHFPYYWAFRRWGQPSSPEMEIANGTIRTNADGSFEIPFTTIPDKQVDPATLPVFTYTVFADVTDINGETQSGSEAVNAGYQSLQIQAGVNEQLDSRKAHQLTIQTRNLNQVPVPADVAISVAPLRFPGKLYRERLWEKPDQYVLSEAEFRKAFPDDEYGDEADYLNWATETPLYQTTLNTGEQTTLELPATLWKQAGWHVIELQAADEKGGTITEKKYVYVSNPTASTRPQTALSVTFSETAVKPSDTLSIAVKTGFDSTYVLESNTDIGSEFNTFSEYRQITRPVTESDRGGLGYRWLYVHNNRVYSAAQQIDVPWTNRDLHIEWATHRNKLLPGAQEEWRLTITGNKKNAVAAEVLAGLYDASLDKLKPHRWSWDKLSPSRYLRNYWNIQGFDATHGSTWQDNMNGSRPATYVKRYDRLFDYARIAYSRTLRMHGIANTAALEAAPAAEEKSIGDGFAGDADSALSEEVAIVGYGEGGDSLANQTDETPAAPSDTMVPVRTNLQETAFFFPELTTDADGNVTVTFTMPEALTEWKLMALAHTTDWKTGYLEGTVQTQKDLMVTPNLPRFLRQGDQVQISARISNISPQALEGIAELTLLDAATLEPVEGFGQGMPQQDFNVAASQSTAVNWLLDVPTDYFAPIVVRITAKAGNFTDGEENTLPVMTNRILVTETLPLPVRGNESRNFTLPKLLEGGSNTLTHHALTVEFTGNPAWYAVQALPYLMEYPYECAEQVFSRFYANALAAHIVDQAPQVKTIFDRWKSSDTTALFSNLEKNQELKTALLEETPWVMEAKDESEQKRRIALLFDSHKLAKGLQQNLAKLAEMQLSDGSFPWFRGMTSNRYITQYIATGIARLQKLGVAGADAEIAKKILTRAVDYLDRQIKADYDRLLTDKADLEKQHIGNSEVQYLYLRSLTGSLPVATEYETAYQYYLTQAAAFWPQFNPYLKGQLALALNRGGNRNAASDIIKSLRETSITSEEMGMYWKSMPRGYWWYEAPVEAQALLIETFSEVANDTDAVDDLKVWLLKQKQTQHWNTTKATADAIYALLLKGSDWLVNEPVVSINIGTETIRSNEQKTEAGTGYFKQRFEGNAITPEMGNISVNVEKATNEGVAWGAVYWQYFENLDKISRAETPLSLQKQLYIERNTDQGPVLEEITATNALKVGDKVRVRIELRVDRDMEYVHLKDMRAACFEPINVLSGYRYQGGLGYYESTRDASTNFFFDYLRKGTYVFEYPVFVAQAGDFSNGISTIQCMYAPEFSSHSAGIRVKVDGGR